MMIQFWCERCEQGRESAGECMDGPGWAPDQRPLEGRQAMKGAVYERE